MLPPGFSSPYVPPPGFKFPGQTDYLRGLVGGIKAIQGDALSEVENSIIVPVKAQLSTTIATIEGATGISVAKIGDVASAVAAIASAQKTSDAISATGRLVDGTLQLVMPAITAALGFAAAELAGCVPVIGQAIGMAVQYFLGLIQTHGLNEQLQAQCDQELAASLDVTCADWLNKTKIVATDRLGGVPADMFRPLAYGVGTTGEVPPCVAAVFAAICSPEARGTWAGSFNAGSAGPNLAPRVPAATKRKMWALIEAILAAVEDPLGVPIGTDGGRTAFPALMSYIWQEKQAGRLSQADVYNCALYIGQSFRWTRVCKQPSAGPFTAAGTFFAKGDCGLRVAGPLSDAFWNLIVQGFHNAMFATSLNYTDPSGTTRTIPWYEPTTKSWHIASGTSGSLDSRGMIGVVTLPSSVVGLMARPVAMKKTATGVTISASLGAPGWQKGVLAATGLSAGFLSYLGVRKLAHGARR